MPEAAVSTDLLFDEAQDRRLAEIFAPCFTLILQLRATSEFGNPDVLRQRIKDLLDQGEREARRLNIHGEEIKRAKFALVAFVDETILSSNWSQKEYWVARPLQLELYDQYDAGEVFFERLEEMLPEPAAYAEALEVYYLCMTLGFKGRYQLHDQDNLRILIEKTFTALTRTPGMASGVLSPHGKPRGQAATEVRSKLPVWVIAVFAVTLALVIYIGMSLYMNSAANTAAERIEQIPTGTMQ